MTAMPSGEISPRPIWVVDDDLSLLAMYRMLLRNAGYEVRTTTDADEVAAAVQVGDCDAVVSDISMPNMTGIELLRIVRSHDLDVPILLVTGNPTVDTAIEAIELGVFRYLTKPIEPQVFLDAVRYAVLAHRLARLKVGALELVANRGWDVGDSVTLAHHFDRALGGIWMAYQPIVDGRSAAIVAFEALVRTGDSVFPHPGALFDAAERLDRVIDLGRVIRARIAETQSVNPAPGDVFVNLHPRDLEDPTLYEAESPLAKIARRVVLEVTERASLSRIKNVRGRIDQLKALGFRIAIDDLGAGYAGLTAVADLVPDVVKFDMSLVRGIDSDPVKTRLLRSMTQVCRDMGILTVGEGVETVAERQTLESIGCDLLQGYYFAKPGRPYPTVGS